MKDRVRILIGVSLWSRYDLELLDRLNDSPNRERHIDVFDFITACRNQTDFQQFFDQGDITTIYQTPVVGWWIDGKQVQMRSGADARRTLSNEL